MLWNPRLNPTDIDISQRTSKPLSASFPNHRSNVANFYHSLSLLVHWYGSQPQMDLRFNILRPPTNVAVNSLSSDM